MRIKTVISESKVQLWALQSEAVINSQGSVLPVPPRLIVTSFLSSGFCSDDDDYNIYIEVMNESAMKIFSVWTNSAVFATFAVHLSAVAHECWIEAGLCLSLRTKHFYEFS